MIFKNIEGFNFVFRISQCFGGNYVKYSSYNRSEIKRRNQRNKQQEAKEMMKIRRRNQITVKFR